MAKSVKSKRRKIIGIILIVLLLFSGVVGGKMYMDYKHDEMLVHKAERIIATQLINSFTGVEEIDFEDTDTKSDPAGGWITVYSLKTSWSSQLSKEDQNKSRDIEYGDPNDPETTLKDIKLWDFFIYGTQKSTNVYDAHRGKTTTPIRVIYSNNQEETLHAK